MVDDPHNQSPENRRAEQGRQYAQWALVGLFAVLSLVALIRYAIPATWWPKGDHSWTDLILVLVTGAYALVTWLQLRELRRTVSAQRESTEAQQRRERRELRAYVGIEDGWLDYTDPDPALLPTALLKIVNSGLTPAMKTTHRCRVSLQSIFTTQFEPITPSDKDPQSVVFPRCAFLGRGALGHHLTEDELRMQNSHLWAVYVYGEIEYLDIYGRKHMTRYRLTGTAIPGKKNVLFFCPDGNDAT